MGRVWAPDSVAGGGSVLEAVLERITFANEETGYTIARVATGRSGPDLITVTGALLGAQVGESLRLTGRWTSHPKYGRQFDVQSFTTVLPATRPGQGRPGAAGPMVLPYPAGAQTSISPRARPSSRRSANRGRGTRSGRGLGTCSLVASKTSRSEAISDGAAKGG